MTPDKIFESCSSHFWVNWGHSGAGPLESLLGHFWVTWILCFCRVRSAHFSKTFKTPRSFREQNISPKFSRINISETPSGHGRPRLLVKDVRAKETWFSCAPSDGVKVFGPGRPPGYPPGRPRDIPPQKFLFGLLFRFWSFEWKHPCCISVPDDWRCPECCSAFPESNLEQIRKHHRNALRVNSESKFLRTVGDSQSPENNRERKMRTKFLCTNFLNTARGPGHPGKIPGTSRIPLFETQERQSFEGGHEVFGHHPFAWKTPTPPGGLRTQKLNLCALFSCLK